jgi:hypothetical protein
LNAKQAQNIDLNGSKSGDLNNLSSNNKIGSESQQNMLERIENAKDCFKNSIAKLELD